MVPVMTPATVSPSPALLTWSPLVEGTHLCNALYSLEGGQLAHDRMNPYNSLHMFLKEGVEGPTANPWSWSWQDNPAKLGRIYLLLNYCVWWQGGSVRTAGLRKIKDSVQNPTRRMACSHFKSDESCSYHNQGYHDWNLDSQWQIGWGLVVFPYQGYSCKASWPIICA